MHWPSLPPLPVGTRAVEAWLRSVTHTACTDGTWDVGVPQGDILAAVVSGGNRPPHNTTYTNHRCYAKRHAIRYIYIQHDFEHSMGVYWNKFFAMKRGLEAIPNGTWMLWVDPDILFTNLHESPHSWVERHVRASYSLLGPPEPHCDIVASGPSQWNAGGLLFRKTCWTMRFFDHWWAIRDQCSNRPHYDQAPFILTAKAVLLGELHIDTRRAPTSYQLSSFMARLVASTHRGACDHLTRPIPPRPHRSTRMCLSQRGFDPAPAIGLSALAFADNPEYWIPGDWFVHFPGSSRPSHAPLRRCFQAFERALDPRARERPVETRYAHELAACDGQESLAYHSPLSAIPNCTRFMYPKATKV